MVMATDTIFPCIERRRAATQSHLQSQSNLYNESTSQRPLAVRFASSLDPTVWFTPTLQRAHSMREERRGRWRQGDPYRYRHYAHSNVTSNTGSGRIGGSDSGIGVGAGGERFTYGEAQSHPEGWLYYGGTGTAAEKRAWLHGRHHSTRSRSRGYAHVKTISSSSGGTTDSSSHNPNFSMVQPYPRPGAPAAPSARYFAGGRSSAAGGRDGRDSAFPSRQSSVRSNSHRRRTGSQISVNERARALEWVRSTSVFSPGVLQEWMLVGGEVECDDGRGGWDDQEYEYGGQRAAYNQGARDKERDVWAIDDDSTDEWAVDGWGGVDPWALRPMAEMY